jgi:hypothetical protein
MSPPSAEVSPPFLPSFVLMFDCGGGSGDILRLPQDGGWR